MLEDLNRWRLSEMGAIVDLLFARSSLGIAFHDLDLRFVYVSETMAAASGRTPAAYLGLRFEELIPEHASIVVPHLAQVLATGEPVLGVQFGDAKRAWLVNYYPIRRADGALVGVGTVAYDDTERQRADRRLRDSERRHRALVETSPDAIVITEDDRITFINAAGLRMAGATDPSEVLGRPQWDFVHPVDLHRAQGEYAAALGEGRHRPYEGRFRRADGSEFLATIEAAIYDFGSGTAVQSVLRDVTAQRAQERERDALFAALEMERGLLHTILRQLPVGVVVLDAQGGLLLANEEAEHIWGGSIRKRAVPFETWFESLQRADGTRIAASDLRITQALRSGVAASDLGIDIVCGDGVARALRGSVAPVLATDGTTLGAVATFWDVTSLTRAQEALRRAHDVLEVRVAERTASLERASERLRHEIAERLQAERQLQRAERLASIGTFAAGIGHEINNPLAAIVATAELVRALVADGGSREQIDAALERIITEAHRGGRIVRRVLRFAREEEGERSPLDVNRVAGRVCAFLTAHVLPSSCVLRTQFAESLPSVLINATELEQIVLNLVRNAAQAEAREVVVETSRQNGAVRLAVRDDGRGIARDALDRIYDPFFTTRQGEGGTGLGLSIVHGLVTACRGTITVESQAGLGTRFVIDLPADATGSVADPGRE